MRTGFIEYNNERRSYLLVEKEDKVQFNPCILKTEDINKNRYVEDAFNFAWDMTFGQEGKHRANRSGGDVRRKDGQIFVDTFQGKLAEFAVYQVYLDKGTSVNYPDLTTEGKGSWDSTDFILGTLHLNVKSSKKYSDLLLLEAKDWSEKGEYIPNIAKGFSHYDYFIFVRIGPVIELLMKQNKWYYSNVGDVNVTREALEEVFVNQEWEFNIPGWITHQDLVEVIGRKQIIDKQTILNPKIGWDGNIVNETGTLMDATNYYVASANFRRG